MSRIWMPGGAGGADLDVVTAGAGDVLKGKVIVGPDGEPLAGTLALSGDAGDSAVLSGKTYYSTDPKQKRTGTMANQGAKTAALNCGGSYTIPAGYHNGQGKVTANSLASQTGVQSGKTAAGAGQVLTGYEAWVNGGRVTGTMANQGKKETALNCGGSYTIPAGYHNGQGKVTANSLASQTGVQSGKTAAGAAQIQTGYEAWVNGGRVTGTMATMNGGTYTPSGSQQTINCAGKKMLSDIVFKGAALYKKYGEKKLTTPTDRKTFTIVNPAGGKNCYYLSFNPGFKPVILYAQLEGEGMTVAVYGPIGGGNGFVTCWQRTTTGNSTEGVGFMVSSGFTISANLVIIPVPIYGSYYVSAVGS